MFEQLRYEECYTVLEYMANKNGTTIVNNPTANLLRKQNNIGGSIQTNIFPDYKLTKLGRKSIIQTNFSITNKINLFLMAILWASSTYGYYLI